MSSGCYRLNLAEVTTCILRFGIQSWFEKIHTDAIIALWTNLTEKREKQDEYNSVHILGTVFVSKRIDVS